MPTHAEVIASTLSAKGVEYVFGLPGDEILAFVDACRRHNLRFILTGHEASAAWIAQVFGQITGIPGVCAATLGPGATNLVTAVANAWLDRAPLLAITAQIPKASYATMTHQRVPLGDLFAPVTKATFTVGDHDTSELIGRSLNLATTPRPGPIHLSLASDVALQESSSSGSDPIQPNSATAPVPPDVLERINNADRPLVIIGLAATSAVRALIEAWNIPFLVTPKAKGLIPEDDPRFLGVASGMARDREIVETIQTADLVIAIGFDPVECDKKWFAGLNVVSIDSASMTEGDYQPKEVIGDITSLTHYLAAARPKSWPSDLTEARRASTFRRPSVEIDGVSPLRLIESLRAVFPREGIATCDVGSHKLAVGQFWRAYEPGTFFMSNGLSGMGFGVPAAIAAQLANPNKPVMAMVGDGGMLMMVHDLALVRSLGLPIIMVVLSDCSLSLIRLAAQRRGYPAYGVDFESPDFAMIARSFGIHGVRVSSVEHATEAVERALQTKSAVLIDVAVDHREYSDLI